MGATKVRVAAAAEIIEGRLLPAQAAGRKLLLARVQGRVCAVVDRCPHRGLSLAKGRLEDGIVTCPWHNSRFDFCSGSNVDWASAFLGIPLPRWTHRALAMGRAPAPLTTARVVEEGGEVFVLL